MGENTTSRVWIKFFLIALAVRLLFVLLFPGVNYYDGITREYLDAANNLLTGHGLTQYIDIAPPSTGLVRYSYEPFIGRPMGYVLFFSLIGLVTGIAPVAFQIVQAIITAFGAVLVWKLVREIFDKSPRREQLASASGFLAALWPNQARFEIALLPDGLTTLIVLGVVLQLTRFLKTQQTKYAVYAGLILAGSIYLRPDLVLFPVVLIPALLLFMRKKVAPKRTITAGIAIAVLLGASIGINTYKNYALSGKIVPLNLSASSAIRSAPLMRMTA